MKDPVHLDEHGRPLILSMSLVVAPEFAGMRVDQFLHKKLRRLSRTKIQRIIKTQLLRADGRPLKPHSPVVVGDELVIRRPARAEPDCPREFSVLYEEPLVRVIDKPAGLPMHATARFYFNTLTRVLAEAYPGETLQICHRVDRETSGCVVLAKSREAASRLKQAFAKKRVHKTYLALVHGHPPWPGEHTLDVPLALAGRDSVHVPIRMLAAPGRADALACLTKVRVVKTYTLPGGAFALVECQPVTGRQHQIRAHLCAAGFPIVGDKLYAHGDDAFKRFYEREIEGVPRAEVLAEFGMARHALHAARVSFPHPDTGARVTVESPLPRDFAEFLAIA